MAQQQPTDDDDFAREYAERVPFEDFAREHLFPIFDAAVAFGLSREEVRAVVERAVKAGGLEGSCERVIEALAAEIERRG